MDLLVISMRHLTCLQADSERYYRHTNKAWSEADTVTFVLLVIMIDAFLFNHKHEGALETR